MTGDVPDTFWLQLTALLAAEVGLIALVVALLKRWNGSAAWSREICRVGVVAVLAVTACEFSGTARVFGGWAMGALSGKPGTGQVGAPATQAAPTAAQSAMRAPPQDGSPRVLPAVVRQARRAVGPASTAVPPAGGASQRAGVWLLIGWILGTVLVAGRTCLARCLFVLFQLRCRTIADPVLEEKVQALASSLGVRRRVRMVQSGRLTSPIAFGLVWPRVGLPQDFSERSDAAGRDSMLAHEVAHLAAHDTCWCLLADIATALLWWHPGVWWLRRQLHLASEMAADEASLLVADGPRVLAECLVELGSRMTRAPLLGQLRVSGFRSHLGRRVHRLVSLDGKTWAPLPRAAALVTRLLGPAALTAAVVLCTAWAAPQALTEGNTMKMMKLNWKRSLTALAMVAAVNTSPATTLMAEAHNPPAAEEAAPAPAPPAVAPAPPQPPSPPAAPEAAQEQFRQRYGLREAPAMPGPPPAVGAVPPPPTGPDSVQELVRRRYGLNPAASPQPAARPGPGAKLEAKLNQIVLDSVKFDNLPLGEVLQYLNDESIKHDPDKAGINFLINPNAPPVVPPVDPNTGLPVPVAPEQVDVKAVQVSFNLPLRKVTMKQVLDAIVTVANHPIEYKVEDFAVVFSAKAEPVVVPAPPEQQLRQQPMLPRYMPPPTKPRRPKISAESTKPQTLNLDFGTGDPSRQTGPAAAGQKGDFWNNVAPDSSGRERCTQEDLDFANHEPSPVEVEMINLGGAWGLPGEMGIDSPMLESYDYPFCNKGGNGRVILHNVPPGHYQVYIYGHSPNPRYYGDYTLSVGDRDYGRKKTIQKGGAAEYSKWVEGAQYVKFSNVKVGAGEDIDILIRPGGRVGDELGRSFSDAMIAGLQLIPMK